jgi:RNA polymerase sigma-70 factor, ECF subfamily
MKRLLLLVAANGRGHGRPIPVSTWSLPFLFANAPVRHTRATKSVSTGWQTEVVAAARKKVGELPDTELVAIVDNFDVFFRDNYANLVRSIGLAVGDTDLAADSVQEAFAKAHVRWNKVSAYSSPVGWVRTVAVNAARDQQRRRVRFDRVRHLIARDERVIDTPELHTPLTDALGTLSPQQRIAATLFYLDDLSVVDVASTMRLSEGAVKFHLSQARERLRPLVGERVP